MKRCQSQWTRRGRGQTRMSGHPPVLCLETWWGGEEGGEARGGREEGGQGGGEGGEGGGEGKGRGAGGGSRKGKGSGRGRGRGRGSGGTHQDRHTVSLHTADRERG